MPYVLLTAPRQYGGAPSERSALGILSRWGERLDDLDGQVTRSGRWDRGGPIRHVSVGFPSAGWRRQPNSSRLFEAEVQRAYRSAALLAMRGQIGVALGHGSSGSGTAWVDLAPGALLRVDLSFMERLYRQTQEPPETRRGLSSHELLFDWIGDVLRTSRSVERVDLYACSVGYGEEGQRLLDWLHYFWRVPVRGLRGDLEVEGNEFNLNIIPRVRVHQRPGARTNPHYGRWYVDRLISTSSLWRRSHRRRPSLSGASASP